MGPSDNAACRACLLFSLQPSQINQLSPGRTWLCGYGLLLLWATAPLVVPRVTVCVASRDTLSSRPFFRVSPLLRTGAMPHGSAVGVTDPHLDEKLLFMCFASPRVCVAGEASDGIPHTAAAILRHHGHLVGYLTPGTALLVARRCHPRSGGRCVVLGHGTLGGRGVGGPDGNSHAAAQAACCPARARGASKHRIFAPPGAHVFDAPG